VYRNQETGGRLKEVEASYLLLKLDQLEVTLKERWHSANSLRSAGLSIVLLGLSCVTIT
jgi:hypothetical protein